MASVPLTFVAPDIEDLVALLIYEAPEQDGPFALIETVEDVGVYPGYIDNYTTDQATSTSDWFAIRWQDAKGAESPLSVPIRGGTTTVVASLIRRTRERNAGLDTRVIQQEAEAATERYFGQDPYTVDLADVSYRVLNGLVYLVLARCLTVQQSQGSADRVTIGLTTIASQSGATVSQKAIDELLALARGELGIDQSVVLQLTAIENVTTTMILEP